MAASERSSFLTILFTDIEGSTALWATDEAAMRVSHTRHNEIIRLLVEECEGVIVKNRGDGFMAVFDDPLNGVRAAVHIQRELNSADWPSATGPIRVRMGLSTGFVEGRDGDYYGTEVNRSSRLEEVAHGGQIVVSESTKALVEDRLGPGESLVDLGRHRLRGLGREEHIYQIQAPHLPESFPPLTGSATRGKSLPEFSTPFFGRSKESDEIAAMFEGEARLVTLLGPGGVGKTRLAVETARRFEVSRPGGVFFSDLVPVSSHEGVGPAVAEALGVHLEGAVDIAGLIAEVLTAPTLLVLDNLDHLTGAGLLVSEILARSPELEILATSRTPLGIQSERICRISPLEVGADDGLSPAEELFYDRATAHGAQLTEADLEAVRSICRQVDGLPLAIELIAARARVLGVAELSRLLQESLDILGSGGADAPERHRTIRDTIEWSLRAVTDNQRDLFGRLSALPAGATLPMVQTICAPDPDSVLDDLTALVDNSLVNTVTDLPGGTRFTQLVPLREYGEEILEVAGERGSTLDRLLEHYLAKAPRLRQGLETFGITEDEMAVDQANLATVMTWALHRGRVEEMAVAMMEVWIFWYNADRLSVIEDWIAKADEETDSPTVDWLVGLVASQKGDFATAASRLSRALEEFTHRDDRRGMALSSLLLSPTIEDPDDARELLEMANEQFIETGDPVGRVLTLLFRSFVDFAVGDYEAYLTRREDALRAAEDRDYGVLIAWMHWNLGLAYITVERLGDASQQLSHAFDYMVGENYQEGIASCIHALAAIEIMSGRLERGVKMLASSEAVFERLGAAPWVEAKHHADQTVELARGQLGEEMFQELADSGRGLSLSESVELTEVALAEQLGASV